MTTSEDTLPREHLRALQTRMLRHAIDHMPKEIDRRAALIIAKNELFKKPPELSLPDECLEAVERPDSPLRWQSTYGPLLVLLLQKTTRTSIELVTLLLSLDVRFRQAALRELDRQLLLGSPFISPDTCAKTEALRSVILEDDTRGLSAAIELCDALRDDYFYNLSGSRQAAQLELEESLRQFLRKVLMPTESMVQFLLRLPTWSPTRQSAELAARLSRIANSQTVPEFLDEYFRYFGHLPLANEFSAASAFAMWLKQHPWQPSFVGKVWSWARQNGSPLAGYHACQLLLAHRTRLSGSEKRELIRQVAAMQVNHGSAKGWSSRCTLAAHYCRRLELLAPGADGERAAAMSWWLAENLARLGDRFSKRANVVYENEIKAASASSWEIWRTCRPPVSASSLRYATLYLPSLWASSALGELAEAKLDALLEQMPKERDTIVQALAQPAACLKALDRSASAEVYAFEHSLGSFQKSVAQLANRHKARKKKRQRSMDSIPELSIEDRIRGLGSGGDPDTVALTLRAASFTDNITATPIWESFSDPTWRRAMLTHGSPRAIELITEAALELVARDHDHDWRSYLPQFLATASEDESISIDGRRALFDMAVFVSLSVDSVSAVERLLKGCRRNHYTEPVNEWRAKIERLTPGAPAWIAARMRGMKSILYVG